MALAHTPPFESLPARTTAPRSNRRIEITGHSLMSLLHLIPLIFVMMGVFARFWAPEWWALRWPTSKDKNLSVASVYGDPPALTEKNEVEDDGDIYCLLQQSHDPADEQESSRPVVSRNHNNSTGDGRAVIINDNDDNVYKTSYVENRNSNEATTVQGTAVLHDNKNRNNLGRTGRAININKNRSIVRD